MCVWALCGAQMTLVHPLPTKQIKNFVGAEEPSAQKWRSGIDKVICVALCVALRLRLLCYAQTAARTDKVIRKVFNLPKFFICLVGRGEQRSNGVLRFSALRMGAQMTLSSASTKWGGADYSVQFLLLERIQLFQ
jgi:hypothetical protein